MAHSALIEKLKALRDGVSKTAYTDWNMAVGRCIQIVEQDEAEHHQHHKEF